MRPTFLSAGGGQRPLLDTRVDEVALLRARSEKKVPIVQIYEHRNGPWSGNNQLGVEIPFSQDETSQQTILKLDEWGYPQTWTLSIIARVPELINAGEIFDASLVVNFGSGGITQTMEADLVDGTTICLPTNAVNVLARWETLPGFTIPPEVRIQALIARGYSRCHATKTRPIVAPLGGVLPVPTVTVISIPPFAKSVQLMPNTAAHAPLLYGAATFLWNWATNKSGTAFSVNGVVPGTFIGPETKIPIPAFARYFFAVNTAGTDFLGKAIFNLFHE